GPKRWHSSSRALPPRRVLRRPHRRQQGRANRHRVPASLFLRPGPHVGFHDDAGFCQDCDARTATGTGTYPTAATATAPAAMARAWIRAGHERFAVAVAAQVPAGAACWRRAGDRTLPEVVGTAWPLCMTRRISKTRHEPISYR